MHSPISSSGDFGQVVQLKTVRKLYDHEKYTLLTTHFVPPRNYKFPTRNVGGRDRCFQYSWLEKHNGLVYSESQDGGYCKFCVLFARDGPKIKLGTLVNRPLIDFKRATESWSPSDSLSLDDCDSTCGSSSTPSQVSTLVAGTLISF